ncbi:MAG: ABC transporter ATP-binding protein [Anaerolineae bacterium]|nr:ABC transporter ATP-binding protein [Anaerolineae bacterium]MDW8173812.1 ABC transporter ATP-binding protein [Anaerolineae bacterium]
MPNKMIELQAVTKRYGNLVALHNVTMSVPRGAILTLLGPSGCGKTTFLRLLAGIQTPDEGAIWLNGRLVADGGGKTFVPPEDRRVGLVFQDYALFPHLDVGHNVAFGLKGTRQEKAARVADMLALVGLTGYERRMPYLLSGGQQQRVALARALAPLPDIMLLDEPFSNLDTALRTQVRSEVRDILRQANMTTVFVTHDQQEALSLSDRVAVIFDGVVQQLGTPQELYNTPCSAEVAAFMGEANFVPAEASGTKALSPLGEVNLFQPMRGPVRLMIRPERLHIEPPHAEGTLALVQWREYYGRSQRIGVKLEDGTPLVVSTDTQVAYERGDRVRLTVFAPLLAFAS